MTKKDESVYAAKAFWSENAYAFWGWALRYEEARVGQKSHVWTRDCAARVSAVKPDAVVHIRGS